jgi:ketosteroid isomerase-like protein
VSTSNTEVARRLLAVLGAGDVEAFRELIDPQVEIHTERGVRHGVDEAVRWAARKFEHLQRRYVVDEIQEAGDRVVVLARVQYVWRESDEVGDEWLLGLVLEFRHGKLRRWRLYDDPIEALEELEA